MEHGHNAHKQQRRSNHSTAAGGARTEARGEVGPPPVCIIEDDEATRQVLRQLLMDEGYEVIEVTNGPAGLALLQSHPERMVVLLDHKLPALDGCDLLDIVANDAALRARHAIIFVTASPQRAEQECGETLAELGAPLVPKPFDIDDVLDAVAEGAQRLAVA